MQLFDRGLVGVDPFDPLLSEELMLRIATECKINFFYFIREIARAPSTSGIGSVPFKANRGNIATYWLLLNHITTILVQIRQTGKSFNIDTLMGYLMEIRCDSTNISMLTKDMPTRTKNLVRLKRIMEEYPFYLKTKPDIANTEEIRFDKRKNTYNGHVPATSPKQANNVGRGLTNAIFHSDETAFTRYIQITLPAALSGGNAVRTLAEERNEPFFNVMTCTACKKDEEEGKFFYRMIMSSALWAEPFFDCTDIHDLKETILANSRSNDLSSLMDEEDKKIASRGSLRVYCDFTHKQLGYSDAWLAEQLAETMSSGEDADRDYFNIHTAGSLRQALSTVVLETMRKTQVREYYVEINQRYKYLLRWYIQEHDIIPYSIRENWIIGLDPSEALGMKNDDIGFIMTSARTGQVISAGNYNTTNIILFSEWLAYLLVKFTNATLVIERRSTGIAIIDNLTLILSNKGINPFRRIFNKVIQEKEEKPQPFELMVLGQGWKRPDLVATYKRSFGFVTSGSGQHARDELYGLLLISVTSNFTKFMKDIILINQLAGLIDDGGRIDHGEGEHDDLVIALLLTHWFITNGKNLEFYGVNKSAILSDMVKEVVVRSSHEEFAIKKQAVIMKQLENYIALLKGEKDFYVIQHLESKIKGLLDNVELTHDNKLTVESLLTDVKKSKRLTNIAKRNS